MGSPRYDEIVELVAGSRGNAEAGGAAQVEEAVMSTRHAARSASRSSSTPAPASRDEAITRAGQLLVAAGAVEASYVEAMHAREASVSTYMGNLLAIPHGTNEAKSAIRRSAISFVRYPEAIEWNGKPVRFVIGIAGAGDDHLALLRRIAEVFVDADQVARLEAATSAAEVMDVLGVVQPA